MVLRGDVAARGTHVDARLVHGAVTVLHLVRLRARGECEELVAEADPEDRHLPPHSPLHRLDGGLALVRKVRKERKERKERKGVLVHAVEEAVDGCRRPQDNHTHHNNNTTCTLVHFSSLTGAVGEEER